MQSFLRIIIESINFIIMSNTLWLSEELTTQIIALQKRMRLPHSNLLLTASPTINTYSPKHRSLTKRVSTEPSDPSSRQHINLTPKKSNRQNMTQLLKMNRTNRQKRQKNMMKRNRKTGLYEQSLTASRNNYIKRTGSPALNKMEYIHAIHGKNEPSLDEIVRTASSRDQSVVNQELKVLINSKYKTGILSRISRLSHQHNKNNISLEAHSMTISSMFYQHSHVSRSSAKRDGKVKIIESKRHKNSVRTEVASVDKKEYLEPWSMELQCKGSKRVETVEAEYVNIPMDLCK